MANPILNHPTPNLESPNFAVAPLYQLVALGNGLAAAKRYSLVDTLALSISKSAQCWQIATGGPRDVRR